MHPLLRARCACLLHLKSASLHHVNQIHAQLITNGLNSPSLYAKLIEQHCSISSTRSANYAHFVFSQFHERNTFLLNTLIRCARPKDSILVFANGFSRKDLVFDDFTYIFVLGACARLSSASTLWTGKQVHGQLFRHGFVSNILVQTTLIHFYANNKDVCSARRVFDEMTTRSNVTWNAMIRGYCSQKECARDTLVLFRHMLVDVCDVRPTATTMVCLLSASAQLSVLENGICIHGYIEKTIYVPENDVFIGTALVDMYSKCGCLYIALSIFRQMEVKNVLTWTAMATGLAIHGKGKETLQLLDAMEASGLKPNAVTFTSLLSACCHAGLVEEGLHLFYNMESKFGVGPQIQHYGCIVDILGRAGHLKEAYNFTMEMSVKPDAILWRSLLSASKVHGDVEMGEKVGKILLGLQPKQNDDLPDASEDYVALSNVYASAERWEDVEIVRKEMKDRRLETKPGCSIVQTSSKF